MDDARTAPDATIQRRSGLRRRAKRGLVASYIHSLSVRHQEAATAAQRPAPAAVPARAK